MGFILGRMDLDNNATWLEIDLAALQSNYLKLGEITGTPVMPVVKANAYGHGLEDVARRFEKAGADWCGVARIEEALTLRNAGIMNKILVLGYTPPQRVPDALKNEIHLTVYDHQVAEAYADQARAFNRRLALHVKVETGMGRLGIKPDNALEFLATLNDKPEFDIEGLFTHFARADEPGSPSTDSQLEIFLKILREAEKNALKPRWIHAANSAAALNFPKSRFDIVRSGIALYGIPPSNETTLPAEFKPVLSWKTRVISIKTLPSGHGVSYGHKYKTNTNERIGVIAAGYGDGLRRQEGNHVLVRGKRTDIVGSVCMDQCMISLQNLPEVCVGDEVVLIGQQNGSRISAEDVARVWHTIPYEVVCAMAARMPRCIVG